MALDNKTIELSERARCTVCGFKSLRHSTLDVEALNGLEHARTLLRLAADTERLREALRPFARPRATTRAGQSGAPEGDVMTVEVTAGDWIYACAALGDLDADYLRALPPHVRPSEAFIERIAALVSPPAEGKEDS